MREGKCFTCFEHGYCSYECSKKKLHFEVKNLKREKSNQINETIELGNCKREVYGKRDERNEGIVHVLTRLITGVCCVMTSGV